MERSRKNCDRFDTLDQAREAYHEECCYWFGGYDGVGGTYIKKNKEPSFKEWLFKKVKDDVTDCTSLGNAASMRKALEKVRRVLHCAIVAGILKGDDVNDAFNEVIAAISAPPRNCDVGTAEEQQDRFREFCRKHFDARECGLGRSVAKCPAYRGEKIPDCSLWWAQMPYDEGSGK